MKKPLSLIILVIALQAILFPTATKADEYVDLYNPDKCTNMENTDADLSGYKVYEEKVYYFYCLVEGMDPKTIKPLVEDGKKSIRYAQDKDSVYYNTRILKGLTPGRFQIMSSDDGSILFLYDANTIYLGGMDISDSGLDINSFESLGNYYYRDKSSLYVQTMTDKTPSGIENFTFKKVAGANPDNFALGYKITPDAVYWYGKKIEEADTGSFELFHLGYAKDKDNVYKDGKIVYGSDAQSFAELGTYYFDKNFEYGIGEKSRIGMTENLRQGYRDYNKSPKIVDDSLSSAIKAYESKYPNYTPQPAQPKPGSPEEAELKMFQAEVEKARLQEAEDRQQNLIMWGGIIVSGLLLGVLGYIVTRRKRG